MKKRRLVLAVSTFLVASSFAPTAQASIVSNGINFNTGAETPILSISASLTFLITTPGTVDYLVSTNG